MSKNKFIQEGIKKGTIRPGALRAKAKAAGAIDKSTGNIKKAWIEKETHSENKKTRKQAVLAQTFSKMRKK